MKPSLKKAFTFIEMLWVLCIVVILISISTIAFRHGQQKARDMVRKNDLQMIADALISYANDHGHFPRSIYDENKPWEPIITVAEAWKKVTESWSYFKLSWNKLVYTPSAETYKKVLGMSESDLNDPTIFEKKTERGYWEEEAEITYTFIWNNEWQEYKQMEWYIENIEKDLPIPTDIKDNIVEFAIVTQWMCVSELKKYLVDNWYLSLIPNDPSWEILNLETNYCIDKNFKIKDWINANSNMNISKPDCYAKWNSGCAKLCKEWYAYVSDWNHFALVAHMESKNAWNYITTACGSCGVECNSNNLKPTRTDTEQLPCDIIDEFTNTFDCIQNTWVVEYSTWQYYFYIY